MPKWAEVARSWSVIFEKVAVHVEPVEHPLRNGLIAAIGHALGVVTAAQVQADGHVVRSVFDRVVDRINVNVDEFVTITSRVAKILTRTEGAGTRADRLEVVGVPKTGARSLSKKEWRRALVVGIDEPPPSAADNILRRFGLKVK